jgi:glutathione S-transferase
MQILDKYLLGKQWILGDKISLADLYIGQNLTIAF